MKLSEAIRLGAMLKPQGFKMFYIDGRTCAIGAALDCSGHLNTEDVYSGAQNAFIEQTWPFVKGDTKCPVCGLSTQTFWAIAHLNDDHRWTREQIADWVQMLESTDVETPAHTATVQT